MHQINTCVPEIGEHWGTVKHREVDRSSRGVGTFPALCRGPLEQINPLNAQGAVEGSSVAPTPPVNVCTPKRWESGLDCLNKTICWAGDGDAAQDEFLQRRRSRPRRAQLLRAQITQSDRGETLSDLWRADGCGVRWREDRWRSLLPAVCAASITGRQHKGKGCLSERDLWLQLANITPAMNHRISSSD